MSGMRTLGGSVVIRPPRWWMTIGMLLAAGFAYGVFRGLWGLAFDHAHAAKGMGVGEQIAAWILGVPLGLLAALGMLIALPTLFGKQGATVLDRERLVFPRGTITLAQATSLAYLPGQQTNWSAPTRPGDHSVRGVGRQRLETRLVIEGAGTYYEFSSLERAWPQVVEILKHWASARPELAKSEESRAFLLRGPTSVVHALGATEPHAPRRGGWLVLWGACSLVVYATILIAYHRFSSMVPGSHADDENHLALVAIPGSLMVGGILALLVAPAVGFVALLLRASRTGDAWAPFVADDLGRFHWMVSGSMSLLRAGERRTTAGLVMRWLVLAVQAAVPVLVVVWFAHFFH